MPLWQGTKLFNVIGNSLIFHPCGFCLFLIVSHLYINNIMNMGQHTMPQNIFSDCPTWKSTRHMVVQWYDVNISMREIKSQHFIMLVLSQDCLSFLLQLKSAYLFARSNCEWMFRFVCTVDYISPNVFAQLKKKSPLPSQIDSLY